METSLEEILKKSGEIKASDIHINANNFSFMRVDGTLSKFTEKVFLTKEIIDLISPYLTKEAKTDFEKYSQCDFAFTSKLGERFRANLYKTSRGVSLALRDIGSKVRSLEDLHSPSIFKKIANLEKGLVIVSGPTGSGKTTTLAAIINEINNTRNKHIITIEDPIEYVHKSNKSLINQREVGRDVLSFSDGLRGALREDPDVIMIGEMRDSETIKMALTAAETGHLVFATLHTMSASKTIDRIIGASPEGEKDVIRSMLSTSIQAIILQTLLKRKEGHGRIGSYEILIATSAVRNLIREEKIHQIDNIILTGSKYGMISMRDYTSELLQTGIIDNTEYDKVCSNLEDV